jgi:hypothetical protein
MATYSAILNGELAAGQPITQSLMTRLRDNPLALIGATPTSVTGSGTYTVPTGINLLRVILVSGGGGGGGGESSGDERGGGGGGSGCVLEAYVSTSGGAGIAYSCGAGGSGGAANIDGGEGGSTTFGALSVGGGQGGYRGNRRLGGGRLTDASTNYPEATPINGFCVAGGNGGRASNQPGQGGSRYPGVQTGTPGTGGTGSKGGGGGAPFGLPMALNTTVSGNGGNGGNDNLSAGGNASGNGAGGGGGGGNGYAGGDGSPGVIFILPMQS